MTHLKNLKLLMASLAITISITSAFAQNVDPIGKDKIANGGYDFVSYQTNHKAEKGSKQFIHEINGIKYLFASAEHRNLFKNNPEKYLPVCDGYCAWGVAEKGIKVPVNPETFKVLDGKLYLFFNGDLNAKPLNTLPEWNKDEQNLLTQLPVNWAKLKK